MPTLYDVAHFCSWNGYADDMKTYLGVDNASLTNQEFHFPFGANVTYGPRKKSRIQRICEEMRPTYNDNNYYAYAIARGYDALKRIQQLLSYGAKPDIKDTIGWTALIECCRNGWEKHKEIAEALINAGADVNQATNDSWTPLYLAANNNHLHIVKLLVSKGANVNMETRYGSPLDVACKKGHMEVIRYLVSKGAVVSENTYKQAIEGENIATIKFLATLAPVPPDSISYAVDNKKILVIPILAKVGADINFVDDGKTPLENAIMTCPKAISYLLKAGANPNRMGGHERYPPIFQMIQMGVTEGVKAMCEHKADVNMLVDVHIHGHLVTPMHYALRLAGFFPDDEEHMNVVKILIKYVNLKIGDSWGDTPIQYATENGMKEIVMLMKRAVLTKKK